MSERDWQPIETAPKDGTQFLAYCVERSAFSYRATYLHDIAWWDDRGTGFYRSVSFAIPTHWMPLPEPPSIEE